MLAMEIAAPRTFDYALAEEAMAALPLDARNRQLTDYWLSLWDGDALPARARFEPARVRDHLPGIMLMEIKPGCYVRARLAGTAVNQAFGIDLTGRDILSLSPPDVRQGRLERNSIVAGGAASFTVRRALSRLGSLVRSQEIQLPFADMTPDGARLVLFHSSWRPEGAEPGVADVVDTLLPPVDWRIIPLWRE